MMSILEKLGLRKAARGLEEKDSPNEIAQRLEGLAGEQSRLVTTFAMVLQRAARADLEVSEDESSRMVEIVCEFGNLSESDAAHVVGLATQLSHQKGSAHSYLATRELKQIVSQDERDRLLRCLFAVCAADDSISLIEEEEVRQIASELGFEHADFTRARAEFGAQREILRGMPKRR